MKKFKREVHGGADTPLYNVWQSMRARCSRPSDTNFRHYGARGIGVCPEWLSSFSTFRTWAVSSGYGPGMSIERRDVNDNYCPENCEWIPLSSQNRNTRATVKLTAFGETKGMADWADDPRCQVSHHLLQTRVTRLKWPHERAISTPKMKKGQRPA